MHLIKEDVMEEYLEHHGILGMKWGIRRYQNENGSLTPAGEKRYGKYRDLTVESAQLLKKTRKAYNDAHSYMSKTNFGKAAEKEPDGYKQYHQMLYFDDIKYRQLIDKADRIGAIYDDAESKKSEEYRRLTNRGKKYVKQILDEIDKEGDKIWKN